MNDIEKAIEDLDTLKNCCKYNYNCGTCEICYKSVPKAQEALEKQKKIFELRDLVWGEDIPSSTCPEYIEHHRSIQKILKFIDEELLS